MHHCAMAHHEHFPVQVPSYTNFFADALIAEAERDSRIIGIHAAMGGGTGMNRFEQRFPERTFDVGIAEQHAVTFAAGELPKSLLGGARLMLRPPQHAHWHLGLY